MDRDHWWLASVSAEPSFMYDATIRGVSASGDVERDALLASLHGEQLPPAGMVLSQEIDPAQILRDRPDVLAAFFQEFNSVNNDRNSDAWINRVGGVTPEDYARYWFDHYGSSEGYEPGSGNAVAQRLEVLKAMSGGDVLSGRTSDGHWLTGILAERPDVLRSYYESYYGPGNDRGSDAWVKRVGGETPQDYANYWYEKYGRWEGYGAGTSIGSDPIDIERLLIERPDVFRRFYEEFYGPNNDRKSSAWVDRVGGETVQDYAKYWYVTYGQQEGYTQRAPLESEPLASPDDEEADEDGTDGSAAVGAAAPESAGLSDLHGPSDDPWNHPEIFPDGVALHEDWESPPNMWHPPLDPCFFG